MSGIDQFIFANGIKLHYIEHGGNEPAIVLMPGLTANANSFDSVAERLSPEHRVLALDLRGRGLSEQPESGYSMADHAADVIGLLDVLGLDRVVLGGHSFGGLLTIYMAATYPDRVAKAVILDAGEMHPNVFEIIGPAVARLGKVYPSWQTYIEAARQQPAYDGWWDTAIESYFRADVMLLDDGQVTPRSRPETIAAASEGVRAENWEELMAAVTQPTLLINAPGPYGPPGAPAVQPEEAGRRTVTLFRDGQYVKVPGNHMTMLYGEGARAIAQAVLTFIDHD